MVSQTTSLTVLTRSRPMALPIQAAPKVQAAPAAVGAPPAAASDTSKTKKADAPALSQATLGALIGAVAAQHGRSEAAHAAHKKPKDPPPAPPPGPPPAPPPPPVVVPEPVVLDDPAPAEFLSMVRERLHEAPPSRYPDLPFSQRDRAPAAAPPAAAQGVFYTPGLFSHMQAAAMTTVAQGQAALAILAAGQRSLYGGLAIPAPLGVSRLV